MKSPRVRAAPDSITKPTSELVFKFWVKVKLPDCKVEPLLRSVLITSKDWAFNLAPELPKLKLSSVSLFKTSWPSTCTKPPSASLIPLFALVPEICLLVRVISPSTNKVPPDLVSNKAPLVPDSLIKSVSCVPPIFTVANLLAAIVTERAVSLLKAIVALVKSKEAVCWASVPETVIWPLLPVVRSKVILPFTVNLDAWELESALTTKEPEPIEILPSYL